MHAPRYRGLAYGHIQCSDKLEKVNGTDVNSTLQHDGGQER